MNKSVIPKGHNIVKYASIYFFVMALALNTDAEGAVKLEGFALLPADTTMPGPDSGHFIGASENLDLPFDGQPAQGFSAIISDRTGGYLALVDNGFGSRENSADFVLRIYFLNPEFRTADGGSGEINIEGFINLSDPDNMMPYPIVAEQECYTSTEPCQMVDEHIIVDRLLTGADLDPESLQQAGDGSFWIGDEFGPYLAHFDVSGVLLQAPYELQGLVSETRPGSVAADHTLRSSRGFEGMAMAPTTAKLYPMLEGPLTADGNTLNIYTFDIENGQFENSSANMPSFRYLPDPAATAVGAFKLIDESSGLILERDSGQGKEALHKKIFRVDLVQTTVGNTLNKVEIADLLMIDDPHDLNQDGKTVFSLPMATIEGLVVIEPDLLGIISDNNYPFGRARGGPEPEATEFILIRIEPEIEILEHK
ncbi:MAG: hypothetical protein ACI9CB_002565 [Rhodothermales bacterium]|jgi:hypothetical protein